MKKTKPLSYWARWITWIWLGSFILVGGTFVVVFFLPFMPTYGSLNLEEAFKILQEIIGYYMPYLGIIFGAYTYSRQRRPWNEVYAGGEKSRLVIVLSLFFNLMVITVFIGHLCDPESNLRVFLGIFRALNAGLAFFIAWHMTNLFNLGVEESIRSMPKNRRK